MALMERDIEEAADHLCKVKKKNAGTVPHFHSSGVKTLSCSEGLVKTVPGMLGNIVSAHWSSKLQVCLIL